MSADLFISAYNLWSPATHCDSPRAEQAERTDTGLTNMTDLRERHCGQTEHEVNCFPGTRRASEACFTGRAGLLPAPCSSAQITSSYMSGGPVSEWDLTL